MRPLRVTVDLAASPAAVWEQIRDVRRHVDWMADAESIELTGGPTAGVGTTMRCRTRVGPITLDDEMEITEWDEPRVMGVRHVGAVTGEGRFTLTPLDGGTRTRFEWSEQLHFPWWLGGRVGAVVAARTVLAAIWRRNLRRLATLVAAGQAGATGSLSGS